MRLIFIGSPGEHRIYTNNLIDYWASAEYLNTESHVLSAMTIDEKIRYGMVALTGAGVVLATFGIHVNPLAVAGGIAGD